MADDAAKSIVDLAAATLTELIRRYCPDLIIGFHLTGSIAEGDFWPGRSDLDFVAVLSRPLTEADSEALTILHRTYGSDPTFPLLDGIWLTESELAAGPDSLGKGPTSHDGVFLEQAVGNRNPVTWFELKRSIPVIGALDKDALWHDAERLKSWVKQNAASYWRGWLADAERPWTARGFGMFGRAMPSWGVLGISRQHYTLATGEVASKSTAGGWALETFDPRHRPIIEEALAYRRGARSLYANPFSRRRDALAFAAMAVSTMTAA
ncbi:MAG TPA: aminoglycoside adenylyltransferase domain-containing protein [Devosia sp.]